MAEAGCRLGSSTTWPKQNGVGVFGPGTQDQAKSCCDSEGWVPRFPVLLGSRSRPEPLLWAVWLVGESAWQEARAAS